MKRILAVFLLLALLCSCGKASASLPQSTEESPFVQDAPVVNEETPQRTTNPVVGMWVSYLEWMNTDFSTEESFRRDFAEICRTAQEVGVNTLYVHVRPFADALYRSEIYPWSSLLTGVQGRDPGYDPLENMVEMAHDAGLEIEAWINPYRIQLNTTLPGCDLAAESPAVLHSDWVKQVDDGYYFDPSMIQVREMVAAGVREIVENYDVDGIQFDDYFYPTTDSAFDSKEYAAANTAESLADWRRSNVNDLVLLVYGEVKYADPDCRFGISPQGNPDNNYNGQYSDVDLWMSTPGYVDYIMPQTYWGFGYQTSSGSTRFAFENITAEWLARPRLDTVALYFGLGAYRIGVGDGGQNPDSESQWCSGHNLADQVSLALEQGADGVAYYRYANLADAAATQEREALAVLAESGYEG